MRTLIRNAHCVFSDGSRTASVLLDGRTIAEIDPDPAVRRDETIDAERLDLIPGVIDDQVHFREPGLTHKEDLHTGSRACAAGGVTTFLEMPNTDPTTTSVDALHAKLSLAATKSIVNYGFYIGATGANMAELASADRTPGIKIFIGSSTGPLLVDDQTALEEIFAETRLPVTAHCEDETTVRRNREAIGTLSSVADHSRIRDENAACVSVRRVIDLVRRHGTQFHVLHVSTAGECRLIRDAKAEGLPLSGEACPHHLFFNVTDYERLGSRIQMNPAVKTPADNAAVWAALHDGTLEVVATDHAPHTLEEKTKSYPESPSGLPAVENSLALMLNAADEGRCTLEQIVAWMCEAPARIWSIPRKGRLEVGYDADVVLVDRTLKRTVRDEEQQTKSKWSPWHGETLTGWPVRTWVGGQCVYRDGHVDTDARGSEVVFRRE